MLKFENNAGTLDHTDANFQKPVLLSVIIKVPSPLCLQKPFLLSVFIKVRSLFSSLSSLRYLLSVMIKVRLCGRDEDSMRLGASHPQLRLTHETSSMPP